MNSQKLLSKNDIKSFTQANRIAITNVIVTDSSYVELDDTAVSSSGGYLKLIGYGFLPGATIYLNGSPVSNTFISSGEYRVVVPAIAPSTVNLMMFNNNNSGAIYTNGVTTSGFPSFTSTTYLTVGTTISVQLLATGDAPLTYSLYSGTLPDGLTLSSSGLISGTVSVSSVTALTVLVNDGQNQTTQQNITLTITVNDPYYPYTTLSLTGESTSNSAFDDASNNRFLITKNGTPGPTPTANTPFANTWSWFVNTSTYYTTTSSANFGFSGQFTMEGWLYWIVPPSGDMNVWGVGASNGMLLYYSGGVYRANKYFVGDLITTSYTPQSNTWHHVAITRDASNLMTVWINGFSAGTATVTGTFATGSWRLGDSRSNDSGGYMSNHRVVNGTCLYTANFTPPTSPLTAINNTVLLVANSNRFVDTSASPFTITQTGSVLLTNTIAPPLSLSDNQSMGSVYFNGTSNFLTTESNTAFALGTGDFTTECWIYPTAWTNTDGTIIDFRQVGASSQVKPRIRLISGSLGYYVSGADRITATITSLNLWYHIALVKLSGSTKIYVNGSQSGSTYTDTNDYGSAAQDIILGQVGDNRSFSSGYFNGYIADARIVKGQALYTANFTATSTSLTTTSQGASSSNVSLLTCNNYGFNDKSNNVIILNPTGQISTTRFSPYSSSNTYTYDDNGTSLYLAPGAGNSLSCTANNNFLTGASNFTIEAWVYPTTNAAGRGISSSWQSGGSYGFNITSSNFLEFFFTDAASGISTKSLTGTSRTVTANSWSHVAVVRNGNTGSLYVNGVADTTTYNFTGVTIYNYNGVAKLNRFGLGADATNQYTGYISNYRFINGDAVYTANFTPPVRPFGYREYSASTKLLLSGASTSVLDSTMQNTLQLNGNVALLPGTSKWGTHSYFFDGTGDYISVYAYARNALSCYFGTGDFTIEAWLYPTTVSKAMTVIDTRTSTGSTTGLALQISATGFPSVFINNATLFTSSTALTINTWTHVAVVRSGTNVTLYLNGTKPSTGNGTSAAACTDRDVTIGTTFNNRDATATNHYQGYIDDLRVTRGYARYVANFTPDTSPNKQL